MKILFEFAGGPFDGKTAEGDRGDNEEADRYFVLTNHGRIGQRFKVASEYAIDRLAEEGLQLDAALHFQKHVYEVRDRIETDEEVLVRAEYVPQPRGKKSE